MSTGAAITLGVIVWCVVAVPLGIAIGKWFDSRRAAEVYDCGHTERTKGCGGCDPGAIEYVYDDKAGRIGASTGTAT